jgi:WD40 repeat protein
MGEISLANSFLMAKFLAALLLACFSSLILAPAGRSDTPAPKGEKGAEKSAARTDLYGDPLPPGAIARLGTMRLRQEGGWFNTAFLDGGKILATAGASGLRFWDTASGRLLTKIKGDFDSAPVLSADGKWLAMREDESLTIREVPSGRLIRRWDPATLKPSFGPPLAFSPDGKVLVEGGVAALRLWDTATGKEIRLLDAQNLGAGAAVFTDQGRRLVAVAIVVAMPGPGRRKNVICHWDLATGKLLKKAPIDLWPQRTLRLSHDGKSVAVVPYSREAVRVFDTDTGKERCHLQGEKSAARYGLTFSSDDRLLATNWWEEREENATISLWKSDTGELVRRLSIPFMVAEDIQFAPDGKTLLTKNAWVVKLWDVKTGKSLLDWPAHESSITTLNYLPDGRTLISRSFNDRTTRIWDVGTGRQQRQLSFCGYADRLLPGGRTILSSALPGAITVRDVETGKVLRRFAFEGGPKTSASLLGLSSDGRTLTALSTKGYHVWDFTTGRVLSHRPDTSGFSASVFSADGKLAAGAHNTITFDEARKDKPFALQPEKTIGVLDVMTGRRLLTLPQPDQFSHAVAFSPDAQTLLTETSELLLEEGKQQYGKHNLHLWELRSGKERLTIPGDKSGWEFSYNTILFSPDGRKLATARADATIQLWDLVPGKELLRRCGYDSRVECLAISPDGKTLASGHYDSTILVWDIAEASRGKSRSRSEGLEAWWTDLAGADARKAHTAIWELVDRPQQAVPLLLDRLKPESAVPSEQFRQLVGELDSRDFQIREAASKKLATFAGDVEPALQQALKASKSPEQRRRIEALLAAPRVVPAGEKLRHLRAVEVLEHIGSPDAQQVLQALAKGAPDARLTQEAKASLERLNPRPVSFP